MGVCVWGGGGWQDRYYIEQMKGGFWRATPSEILVKCSATYTVRRKAVYLYVYLIQCPCSPYRATSHKSGEKGVLLDLNIVR